MNAPPAELLLGRPEFADDLVGAAGAFQGQRVLITGAAGSVGWPLTQLLVGATPTPERLVLLDQHEYSLFSLERTLRGRAASLAFELADVREGQRIRRVFEEYRPDVVIHLAASKHVPYAERFPEGAVASNVLATRRLLELSQEFNVARFVYPSSDKSVQPAGVYGATKRLAEALVQFMAQDHRWAVVRYVNIIGTRGSVIETFTQQILDQRPLSVTDDRMTRYWISMDEALWCALMALQSASPGEIVMPACGEPVPLMETARRLAGWYRPEEVPYPIDCTGMRPGERLHEILLSPNESFASDVVAPGVRAVRSTRSHSTLARIADVVDQLQALVERGDRAGLSQSCLAAADALQ